MTITGCTVSTPDPASSRDGHSNAHDLSPAVSARRVRGEVLLLVAPLLAVGAFISWRCALEQVFIGTWDIPQIFWQGRNLLRVFETGDANLTDSFLGLPTPFTYTTSVHGFSLPLLALTRVTNPWFAYNMLFFVVLAANGASMYAVLRLVGLRRGAAAVGGLVYLLAPTTLVRSLAHVYLAQTWHLPWMFWLMYRDRVEGPRAPHWVAFGVFMALLHGAHEYLGLLGFALLGVALVCRVHDLGIARVARAGAMALLAYGVLSAPVLWMYASQRLYDVAHDIHPRRPIWESIYLSASPADFLMPSNGSLVYRNFAVLTQENRITENFNYLGLVNIATVLVLASWALWRRDRLRAFAEESPFLRTLRRELSITGLGALVVSLGPRWKYAPWIVLPVALLQVVPPFHMVRGWGRYGYVLFFVLALVTAHLVAFLMRRARRPALVAFALAVVVAVDQIPLLEIPHFRMPFPSALSEIAAEPGRFAVLHLPFHSTSGAQHTGTSQLLQAFHGKRIVGGYASFDPPLFLQTLRTTPLAAIDGTDLRPMSRASTAAFASWLLNADVRYIVYEKKTQYVQEHFTVGADLALRAATVPLLDDLARTGTLRCIEDDEDYNAYRVVP